MPMSNPTLDHQVRIAFRDDQKAEKFAEHVAELGAQIVKATFKFSQDVASTYDLIPKRRLGDKNFDEIDRARLTLGAFNFFIHILDRYLLGMDTRLPRETVLGFIFENLIQIYAKSFPGSPSQTENFVLNHYECRASQLAEAPSIFGEGPGDRNTVMWHAGRAICGEDLGRDDHRLLAIVGDHLMRELESLALSDHITAMAEELCLPTDLRKTA